jgi:hypothetical protein
MDGSARQPAAEAGVGSTPAGWSGRIADLDGERRQAERELVEVIAKRRALAVIDHAGDRAAAAQASAQIGWLNQRHRELVTQIDNLNAGKAAAAERLGAALEGRQRGQAEVRHGDPAALAKAIVAQAARVDSALRMLADALTARQALARRLAGLGAVNFRTIQNPARIRGAVAHHDLPHWLETTVGPPRLHAPLVEADRMILRHLLAPRRPPAAVTDKETAA